MIPIAGMVVARVVAVVDAGAVVVAAEAGGAIALTTVVARPTRTRRRARRAIINPRPFPPATIARNIRTRSKWPRSARWHVMTVSARRTRRRTKTTVAKAAASRKIPASANSAKNLLMTAMPRRCRPTNVVTKRRNTNQRNNVNRIHDEMIFAETNRGVTIRAVMNRAVTTAVSIHSRAMVAIRKIIVRKTVVGNRRTTVGRAEASSTVEAISHRTIVRKTVVSSTPANNLTVAATNRKGTVRAVIVATDAARRRAVVAAATGSSLARTESCGI